MGTSVLVGSIYLHNLPMLHGVRPKETCLQETHDERYLEKRVGRSLTTGHSLKNLDHSQKTLRPNWCPRLVTGLLTMHNPHQTNK